VNTTASIPRIPTSTWSADQAGRIVNERALPLGVIAQALRDALAREGLIDEYFVTVPGSGAADFPIKADRIACYATRGGNEGYLVRVDALIPEDDHLVVMQLFIGKAWSRNTAQRAASLCAELLDV
jgi:hypothetical protein